MIRSFLLRYLDFVYLSLLDPGGLPDFIRRAGRVRWFSTLNLVLLSVDGSIGLLILQDYQTGKVWIEWILLNLLAFIFLFFWSLIFSGLLIQIAGHSFEIRLDPEKEKSVFHLVLNSLVPYIFFMPATLSTVDMDRPLILLIPVLLALTFWSISILVSGIQSLFQTGQRRSFLLFFLTALVASGFPVLSAITGMIVIGVIAL